MNDVSSITAKYWKNTTEPSLKVEQMLFQPTTIHNVNYTEMSSKINS